MLCQDILPRPLVRRVRHVPSTRTEPPPTAPLPRSLLESLPYLCTRVLFPGLPDSAVPDTAAAWRWAPTLVLCLVTSALILPSLSAHLFEPDEGRYAQIPREMLTRGDWIVPTLHGEPYLDKPPLFYWLVMTSYSVFG